MRCKTIDWVKEASKKIEPIMFTNKSTYIKIGIVFLAFIVSTVISYLLYKRLIVETSMFLSTVILFCMTWSIIFFAFMIFQTFKYFRFPMYYYKRRKLESELFFKSIGVPIFRKILINSFFRYLNRRVYLKGKKGDRFVKFMEETKQSETSHFISLVITIGIQVLLIINYRLYDFLMLLIFNVIFNFYPILLQRMNRFIIEKRMGIHQ